MPTTNTDMVYRVDTEWSEDLIAQTVSQDLNGIREEMYRNIVRLQDEGIRKALIALGWTPPAS